MFRVNPQARAKYEMHLSELFDSHVALTQVSPREAGAKYGLRDVVWAYSFAANGKTYIVYCDACSGSQDDLTLGFAVADEEGSNHRPTGDNAPFEIFGPVLQALRAGIEKNPPITMSFRGSNEKQTRIYAKLIQRLAGEMPEYKAYVYEAGRRLYLSKDPGMAEKPWAIPFADFLKDRGFRYFG